MAVDRFSYGVRCSAPLFFLFLEEKTKAVPSTALHRKTDPPPSTRAARATAMLGLFVVGTDTGVGKTFVTAAAARALRQQGKPVSVCKPVATGGEWVGGRLLSD